MGNKSVSIVIPAYNEGNNISATLEGIASQGDFRLLLWMIQMMIHQTRPEISVKMSRLPVNSGKEKLLKKECKR